MRTSWPTLLAGSRFPSFPEHYSVCLPCPLPCQPRIDFQFLRRSFYIIYWVGNFFSRFPLDNAVWIGQKLNSFAYMRIIYILLTPCTHRGAAGGRRGRSLSSCSKKWKAKTENRKPKSETGKRKTESGKLCSLPNGQGSQSSKKTFIKSKQSPSWCACPPAPHYPLLWSSALNVFDAFRAFECQMSFVPSSAILHFQLALFHNFCKSFFALFLHSSWRW